MDNKIDKLFAKKKKGKELSDNEKDAKMSVVSALRDFAAGEMGKKVSGLKKPVEGIAALKVEMASKPEGEEVEDEDMEEDGEDEGQGLHPGEVEMSEEEIDAKLQELMALKAKIKA